MVLWVVQWATGPVGRHALAAVVAHPELAVAGVRVYADEKVARRRELCGWEPIGVVATASREEILALDDCVLYMARGDADPPPALDDMCDLLASGKNVVSTALTPLIHPAAMGPEVVDRLVDACARGGATFHGTGIEAGWASEVLPLVVSSVLCRVDSLVVQEILDYATYDNAFMLFDVMGFGRAPDDASVIGHDPSVLGGVFRAPLMLVADGLAAQIEDITFDRQVELADRSFDVAPGRIESGTVEAVRFGATAIIDGRPALGVEHVTRLRPEAAPDWPGGEGWRLTVEGTPPIVLEARVGIHDEDHNDQGCLATAMHAVHAIAPVCAAAPGITTFLDLPTIVGRHVLDR